jgi:hypothetical protein
MNKKRKPGSEPPLRKVEIPQYGNPEYTSEEDIYSKEKKESLNEESSDADIKDGKTEEPLTGDDLDIPGAESDDANEKIGEEDEENNYYSLSGDDHDDLEEDKG